MALKNNWIENDEYTANDQNDVANAINQHDIDIWQNTNSIQQNANSIQQNANGIQQNTQAITDLASSAVSLNSNGVISNPEITGFIIENLGSFSGMTALSAAIDGLVTTNDRRIFRFAYAGLTHLLEVYAVSGGQASGTRQVLKGTLDIAWGELNGDSFNYEYKQLTRLFINNSGSWGNWEYLSNNNAVDILDNNGKVASEYLNSVILFDGFTDNTAQNSSAATFNKIVFCRGRFGTGGVQNVFGAEYNGVYYSNWLGREGAYSDSSFKPYTNKIYIDTTTDIAYRWNGNELVSISGGTGVDLGNTIGFSEIVSGSALANSYDGTGDDVVYIRKSIIGAGMSGLFALRVIDGTTTYYYSNWNGRESYQDGFTPYRDKVYKDRSTGILYTWEDDLVPVIDLADYLKNGQNNKAVILGGTSVDIVSDANIQLTPSGKALYKGSELATVDGLHDSQESLFTSANPRKGVLYLNNGISMAPGLNYFGPFEVRDNNEVYRVETIAGSEYYYKLIDESNIITIGDVLSLTNNSTAAQIQTVIGMASSDFITKLQSGVKVVGVSPNQSYDIIYTLQDDGTNYNITITFDTVDIVTNPANPSFSRTRHYIIIWTLKSNITNWSITTHTHTVEG